MDIAHLSSTFLAAFGTFALICGVFVTLSYVLVSCVESLKFTWDVPEVVLYVVNDIEERDGSLWFSTCPRYLLAVKNLGAWTVYAGNKATHGCLALPFSPFARFLNNVRREIVEERREVKETPPPQDAPRWSDQDFT
jgi:hypothetical protein